MPLPVFDCSTGERGWRQTYIGVGLGLLSIIIQQAIIFLAPILHWKIYSPVFHKSPFFILAILMILIAPPLEEWIFRGILQSWLKHYMPIILAILISSFLFTLAHVQYSNNFPALLSIFILGLLYGYSREATGSLIPGIIAHGLVNLFALGMLWQ